MTDQLLQRARARLTLARDLTDEAQADLEVMRELVAKVDGLEGVLHMTVARLGGQVEGRPTERVNFLQRVDQLVAIEQALREMTVNDCFCDALGEGAMHSPECAAIMRVLRGTDGQ